MKKVSRVLSVAAMVFGAGTMMCAAQVVIPLTVDEANTTVAAGNMQILIARNAGLDQDPSIDTITVGHSIPPAPKGTVFIL